AAFLVFDNPELVDLPFVRRWLGPGGIDLREGTERPLAGDAHLVAALYRPFDFSFHRKMGPVRVLELPLRRGAAHQLSRERQPSLGRHDGGLNAVANGDLEVA